jgi:hypothetical protein
MHTKPKIKINDNDELREKLCDLFNCADQVVIAQWAILLAKHVLELCAINYESNTTIMEAMEINKKWQIGIARMYDVRQAGFSIHKLAKNEKDIKRQTAYRVVGQAVGTGHMKEHGIVASDYSIKCINIIFDNNYNKIIEERNWQICILNDLLRKLNEENKIEFFPYIVNYENVRLYCEPDVKSQTVMYLTKGQHVVVIIDEDNKGKQSSNENDWIKIKTQTRKSGWCSKKHLSNREDKMTCSSI